MADEGTWQKASPSTERSGQKKTIITILSTMVVTIIVVLGIVFLVMPTNDNEQPDNSLQSSDGVPKTQREVLVTPENVEEVVAEIETKKVEPGRYRVRMNTEWEFEDGTSTSRNAIVENADTNTNAVYFDVARSDTGEIIYSSPILPIGSRLDEITLDTDLDAGEYACVLTYYLIDEEQIPISKLNVSVDIIIEN